LEEDRLRPGARGSTGLIVTAPGFVPGFDAGTQRVLSASGGVGVPDPGVKVHLMDPRLVSWMPVLCTVTVELASLVSAGAEGRSC
jgi:hypothetical protein